MRANLIRAVLIVFMLTGSAAAVDHGQYLKDSYPGGPAVTQDCLKCHQKQAENFMETAHWLWQGPSPHVAGQPEDLRLGKRNLINNY